MPNQPNIVFVMMDTVRADALGSYGAGRMLGNIDRIARRSIVFDNAIAPSTYTLPSHLSIFLGRRPRSIRALMKNNIKNYNHKTDPFLKKSKYIKGGDVTLAKHLSFLGYNTALFSNNPFVSASAGVADGFSYVDNMFVDRKLKEGSFSVKLILNMIDKDIVRNNLIRMAYLMSGVFPDETLDRMYLRLRRKVMEHFSEESGYYSIDSGARQTNSRIRSYLQSAGTDRNFIFVNYMEGHEGYPTNLITGEKVVQDKWIRMIGGDVGSDIGVEKAAYIKRINYLDDRIGELLRILKKNGTLDNAYVIFAGDHGQAFMEHGQMYHNVFPYNEVVKVPLIISRFENGRQMDIGRRVRPPTSLTALNRTIIDMGYGGGEEEIGLENRTVVSDHLGITEVWDTYLLKLLRQRSRHADAVYRSKLHFNTFATAIFSGDYKLIHFYGKKRDELYRMSEDSSEERNIIGSNKAVARRMIEYNEAVA